MTTEAKIQFAQYQFWRVDGSFMALESNEKIVAKQQFLGTWEGFQRRALLVSYSLTGLRTDCDILCLRVADSLEFLQDMTCRVQSSGLGKFFAPAYSYLAMLEGVRWADKPDGGAFVPGQGGRYLFLTPFIRAGEAGEGPPEGGLDRELAEAAAKAGVRLQPGLRCGFDEVADLVAAETDKPEEYPAFAAYVRGLRERAGESFAGPAFACVQKDIRDIVDCLG